MAAKTSFLFWAKGPADKKYLPISRVEDYEKIFE
jgi:hypothetical protein